MKNKIIIMLTFLLTTSFVFTGCFNGFPFSNKSPFETETLTGGQFLVKAELFGQKFESKWPSDPNEPSEEFYKALHDFTFEMFTEIDPESKNNMISPASVFLALAMTLNGADGETKSEMINALQANGFTVEDINKAARDYLILSKDSKGSTVLEIANSIWFKEGFTPDKEFLQRNVDFYMANARDLDFNDSKSVDIINGWVKEATKGTIEEIVDSISADTVMFLINAIYFNAKWQEPFLGEDTFEGDFNSLSETLKVDFMNRIGNMDYLDFDNAKGIALPYDDERFVFVALLPEEGKDLKEIYTYFSRENLAGVFNQAKKNKVNLTIPKFEHEYELSMNDTLKALGMVKAFDSGMADLSLINESRERNLYIHEVKHKTYIRFFEKGTEAAAVTSVEIRLTSLPSSDVVLTFDRPFVYAIVDTNNNIPLFIGNFYEP